MLYRFGNGQTHGNGRVLPKSFRGEVASMNPIDLAYDKYAIERLPLPKEADIRALEQRLRIEFPPDYRQYILEFNGGYFRAPAIDAPDEDAPRDALSLICGIGAPHWESELGHDRYLSIFDENDPLIILPIGDTELGGLILLVIEDDGRGEILLKKAYGDAYFLAEGIEEFFSLLRDPVVE